MLDSEVTWWGVGAVQKIDAATMDIYVAYRQYQADATVDGGPANQIPANLNDIWLIQTGARIQFQGRAGSGSDRPDAVVRPDLCRAA